MSKVWLVSDYSQAEARVVAWAGVPTLRKLFESGQDVHLYVCKQIARHIQEQRISMPIIPFKLEDGTEIFRKIFSWKPWAEFTDEDPERYTSKRTVHANHYGMGKNKFSQITRIPTQYAGIIQELYHTIMNNEVRLGYQAWIDGQLRRDRTITTPQGFRRTFYDIDGPELSRAAYAFYPQTTVGLKLVETLTLACEVFESEGLSPVHWYPHSIRQAGFNVRLQMHDSVDVSVEESEVMEVARTLKKIGESPLIVHGEELVIPMDFKSGKTLREKASTDKEDHPDFLRKLKV